jgi:hypothetical protein
MLPCSSAVSPRFTGFYEVQTTRPALEALPIGGGHGIPYMQEGSVAVPGTRWVYVVPEADERFQSVLAQAGISFTQQSLDGLADRYSPAGQAEAFKRSTDKTNRQHLYNLAHLLSQWANDRLRQLLS